MVPYSKFMSAAVGQYKVNPGGTGGAGVGGPGGVGGAGVGEGPSGHHVPPQLPQWLAVLQYSPGLLQLVGFVVQPE